MRRGGVLLAVLAVVLAVAAGMVCLASPRPAVRAPSDLVYLPATVLDAVKERFETGELDGPIEVGEAQTSRDGRYTRYRFRAFTTVQGRRFRVWTTAVYDRQRNIVLGWIDQ